MLIQFFDDSIWGFSILSRQRLRLDFVYFDVCGRKFVLFGIKEKMQNVYSFTAALRVFHYYGKFLKPIENGKINCLCEIPYNSFAIKTVTNNGEIIGYLLREDSRVCKIFSLPWSNPVSRELTDFEHYLCLLLVQGGMEIV